MLYIYVAKMKHSQLPKSQVVAHTSVCWPSCTCVHNRIKHAIKHTYIYTLLSFYIIYKLRTHQLEGYYACIYNYIYNYIIHSLLLTAIGIYDMVDHPVQS